MPIVSIHYPDSHSGGAPLDYYTAEDAKRALAEMRSLLVHPPNLASRAVAEGILLSGKNPQSLFNAGF